MMVCDHSYEAQFLDQKRADYLLQTLQTETHWQRENFSIFGRTQQAPRWTAWYGEPGVTYRYTGIDHVGHGWPRMFVPLLQDLASATGQAFNFAIANRYDHGGHHMGWHRDDEQGIHPLIASLSLGATRRFTLQKGKQEKCSFDLQHGSLLCFDGRNRHILRKTKKSAGTRINLTFRIIHRDC